MLQDFGMLSYRRVAIGAVPTAAFPTRTSPCTQMHGALGPAALSECLMLLYSARLFTLLHIGTTHHLWALCAVCPAAILCTAVLPCRYETNLLNTAGQAMEFLADINHDNVYVHLVCARIAAWAAADQEAGMEGECG